MTIGQRIRSRRNALGLTHKEIAAELGVTRQAVSLWENGGSKPRVELLPALAEQLQTTVDDLLEGVA